MALLGIAHVQVIISQGGEAAARRFYGELLGLAEVAKPANLADRGGCWFEIGDQQIHCGVDTAVPSGRHHPAFLTDELDALRRRLEFADVRIADHRDLPGYRRFYAFDPFGNRLEFLEASAS